MGIFFDHSKQTEVSCYKLQQMYGSRRSKCKQGARKDGFGNEPVGSCAMCDARSTGSTALEGKNR